MIVLGIETSCDETAASVVDGSGVRSDEIWSQSLHSVYGGVVPELASRAHAQQIVPVVRASLAKAGVTRPDAIAVTAGPGLMGAVLVGLSFAKGASIGWGVPWIAVNHLEGHLLSGLMEADPPQFPFLSLVVSGGHTTLYRVDGLCQVKVVQGLGVVGQMGGIHLSVIPAYMLHACFYVAVQVYVDPLAGTRRTALAQF